MDRPSVAPTVQKAQPAGCERLDAAWRGWRAGTAPPSWADYLPAPGEPCDPDQVFLLFQIDVEHRARAGLPALLGEPYFRHPRLAQPDAALDEARQAELIRWEYQQRWKNGDRARRDDYLVAFPKLADSLGDLRPRWTCPRCRRAVFMDNEAVETLCCHECDTNYAVTAIFRPRARPSAAPAPAPACEVGLDLRNYELFGQLGRGGMGEVYRGRDPALGRELAVKVIRASYRGHAAVERRFIDEARVTGSLEHPDIVPVHNVGRLPDGRLYYTMKLVRGRTLAELLAGGTADKPERLRELLGAFVKVYQAVAYAHSRGVIHRDLKPANVMVGAFGEVQVMDWGSPRSWRTATVRERRPRHRTASRRSRRRTTGARRPAK